ncbi:DgyrCDS5936 [Dimorphilus gyrociliatus]|uniref:DgyrCDS5936 n=1 Tax=Dimorphilus gyrociliatus TaxID=2664684 RepID=A0A7I8VNU3_9ANNE|nr:DgyrCDS5936 [Dimorphilus gyrociliatus]
MGKSKRKDKKGKGAEKTAAKTEKKAEKRNKKNLKEQGEEDIELIIAELAEADRKREQVITEKCEPPSPRAHCSWTSFEEKHLILLFGGEHLTGSKINVYNELYFYCSKNNTWTKVKAPNAPPPRSSHQAICLKRGGGELWIFGGEFTSPTQSQFYHYRDLWMFQIKERKWQKIDAPKAPSSRSGHRMILCKRNIFVFGGFHDNGRDYKYFNDLHMFNVDNYTWTKIDTCGIPPSPRSGCQLVLHPNQQSIIVYGGYSKVNVKKDIDRGTILSDMFLLSSQNNETGADVKWKWSQIKHSGSKPNPRSGFSMISTAQNRAFLFGGVIDEEDDEDVEGLFLNDMYSLDLDRTKWYQVFLQEKVEEKKVSEKADDLMESSEAPETTVVEDGVFTLTIEKSDAMEIDDSIPTDITEKFQPHPRMNTSLAVHGNILYLYGGIYEKGDVQVTCNDLYSINTQKFDSWRVLVAPTQEAEQWDDSDEDKDEDSEENESDEDEEMEDSPPPLKNDEELSEYFGRTKDYWMQIADEEAEEKNVKLSAKQLKSNALELARLFVKR